MIWNVAILSFITLLETSSAFSPRLSPLTSKTTEGNSLLSISSDDICGAPSIQIRPDLFDRTMVSLNNKKGAKVKKKGSRAKPKGFAGALRDLQMNAFKYTGDVRPGTQSPQRVVNEDGIMRPDYADDGTPKNARATFPWVIEVKTPDEIKKMRAAGRVAREVLDIAGRAVKPGVTTDEIDAIVHAASLERGAYPSPLNYHGFPKSCCTSVNEIICHGIPDDRKLVEGDIVNVDITCYLDGYHGDCSEMFCVGEVDDDAKKLLQVTYDCWVAALNYVKPGRDYKDIGGIIEDYVTPYGFTTVRNFCGHGIGSVFHTTPNILHYTNNEPNGQMAPGHTFTIEPMICEGIAKAVTWPDQWTAATVDGKRTAQFEHTLLITEDGVEPLTGKLDSSPVQFWEKESKVHQGIWTGTASKNSPVA
eukprot:CAMPEP_0195520678 /NCGR_PEP_ID=MMETSP0794_2-20130614/17413_1 /TAXON_ID=515487 /ORGANISM="Stephanopyxis turris, Strain CCMP 815" /LENGTH=418 /DNA_ID=CAMNT_0040650089 /DNA_START=38 /DNA_END=1294 /DNA_ORIENTATION=+